MADTTSTVAAYFDVKSPQYGDSYLNLIVLVQDILKCCQDNILEFFNFKTFFTKSKIKRFTNHWKTGIFIPISETLYQNGSALLKDCFIMV